MQGQYLKPCISHSENHKILQSMVSTKNWKIF